MTNRTPLSPAAMQIILRHAKDDFTALMTAQGMEDAGAQVFSITMNSTNQPMLRFLVFARYNSHDLSPHQIDAFIEKRLMQNAEINND